jgi:sec-independent protein translocase protein TatA
LPKEKRQQFIPLQQSGKIRKWFNMHTLALGFGNFGGPDLIVILLIVLVLFGAKKLPELARGLGQSLNEFRKARAELDHELHSASNDLKSRPQSYRPVQEVRPDQPPT